MDAKKENELKEWLFVHWNILDSWRATALHSLAVGLIKHTGSSKSRSAGSLETSKQVGAKLCRAASLQEMCLRLLFESQHRVE